MARDLEYKKFVHRLAVTGDDRIFLNSDKDHALDVLVEIFQLSQKKIRIFAGCLCEPVGDQPDYIMALSEFIERDGELVILLNAYDEKCAKVSNLYKRLAYYKSENKPIVVKQTTAKPYLENDPEKKEVHFTVGDESSYRLETDVEQRTAECCLKSPITAKKIADFFDDLFVQEESIEIDLIKLFENDD